MGEKKKVYKLLVGKPEEKRPLLRPQRRWEYWFKMDWGRLAGGRCGLDSTGSG
jgi:hypothetical protein